MKVRMLTSVAGVDEHGDPYDWPAGEILDLPTKVARDLCARPADMPRAEPVAETRAKKRETR